MTITREENDEIQKELVEQIEEKVQKEHPEVKGDATEGEPSTEKTEETEPYWAQKGFKSEADFIKSYEHAQTTIGKQGSELGEIRKTLEELKPKAEEKPEKEPYTEYDELDPENVKYFTKKWAREENERIRKEEEDRRAAENAEEDHLKMISRFVKNHEDLDREEAKDVAAFARNNGIFDLEHAYIVMNANKSPEEVAATPPPNIKDIPPTLTGSGTGGNAERTADDFTQSEWDGLTNEEREQYLREDS